MLSRSSQDIRDVEKFKIELLISIASELGLNRISLEQYGGLNEPPLPASETFSRFFFFFLLGFSFVGLIIESDAK